MSFGLVVGLPLLFFNLYEFMGLMDCFNFLANIDKAKLLCKRNLTIDQQRDFSACSESKVSRALAVDLIQQFLRWGLAVPVVKFL